MATRFINGKLVTFVTIEEKVAKEAFLQWEEMLSARVDLGINGPKSNELERQIRSAITNGLTDAAPISPITRVYNEKCGKQSAAKLTREEKEDMGMGFYSAGQWVEFSK